MLKMENTTNIPFCNEIIKKLCTLLFSHTYNENTLVALCATLQKQTNYMTRRNALEKKVLKPLTRLTMLK